MRRHRRGSSQRTRKHAELLSQLQSQWSGEKKESASSPGISHSSLDLVPLSRCRPSQDETLIEIADARKEFAANSRRALECDLTQFDCDHASAWRVRIALDRV